MRTVDIIGGGPAGAMAAIAALRAGAEVRVFEKSAFPRHKVCGEFLSPQVLDLLRGAGCADPFLRVGPASIRRMELHFGTRVVRRVLPRTAYGLSRYALDRLLLEHAAALGADIVRETASVRVTRRPLILTNGRTTLAKTGARFFGFKTHFRGTVGDTVGLFFFDGCYAGLSAVEDGQVNLCGLAPEALLRECGFDPRRLLERCPPLRARIDGMEPLHEWLRTGPLVMGWAAGAPLESGVYPAGDALGFIDPFTGSGILNAMLAGRQAGTAAARGTSAQEYLASSRRALRRPLIVSAVFRRAVAMGVAGPLASLVPGSWLFHVTRPPDDDRAMAIQGMATTP